MLQNEQTIIFCDILLNWYKNNKRNLPWRNSTDPYNILIAEILLQKTDANKIKKVYPLFIDRFPTIYHLNKADSEKIYELIKSIGLKYRVNRLKKIAKKIIEEFNGNIPCDKSDLLSLKGVGDYIAYAILCFAYNERVPILDVNISRIYNRFFKVNTLKKRPHLDKNMWLFAEKILPYENYVDYNYALLDFGSLICKKKEPLCMICELNKYCMC